MTTPTFTTPPDAPQRTDTPADFVTKANAFVAWLVIFAGQLVTGINWIADQVATVIASAAAALVSENAAAGSAAAAIAVTGYVATSATSLTLGAGVQAVTLVESSKIFANAQRATLIRVGDPNTRMSGVISSANMGAQTMTVTTDTFSGAAGSYSDWLVILSALESVPPDLAKAFAIAAAVAL